MDAPPSIRVENDRPEERSIHIRYRPAVLGLGAYDPRDDRIYLREGAQDALQIPGVARCIVGHELTHQAHLRMQPNDQSKLHDWFLNIPEGKVALRDFATALYTDPMGGVEYLRFHSQWDERDSTGSLLFKDQRGFTISRGPLQGQTVSLAKLSSELVAYMHFQELTDQDKQAVYEFRNRRPGAGRNDPRLVMANYMKTLLNKANPDIYKYIQGMIFPQPETVERVLDELFANYNLGQPRALRRYPKRP